MSSLPQPAHSRSGTDRVGTLHRLRIVIVGACEPSARAIAEPLQALGQAPYVGWDADAALDHLADQRADVVYLDQSLVGMQSAEFLRHLRVMEAGRRGSLAVIVGVADPAELPRGAHRGLPLPLSRDAVAESLTWAIATQARGPIPPLTTGPAIALPPAEPVPSADAVEGYRQALESSLFDRTGEKWIATCAALGRLADGVGHVELQRCANGLAELVDSPLDQKLLALRMLDRVLRSMGVAPAADD